VFDPLAIMMVLAATESMKWERERRLQPTYAPDDGPLTDQQVEQLRATAQPELPTADIVETSKLFDDPGEHPADTFDHELETTKAVDPHPPGWMFGDSQSNHLNKQHVAKVIAEFEQLRAQPVEFNQDYLNTLTQDVESEEDNNPDVKAAIKQWKAENPDKTIKEERAKLAAGRIQELPWMGLAADNDLAREHTSGFGISFPAAPIKGDTFMRVDQMPNVLYKFNGHHWIIVDKTLTDNYTYDDAYIEHLIAKLTSGEYDPDMLSDAEADAIARRVKSITI